jgi:ATP-binding cassette subfamily B protein
MKRDQSGGPPAASPERPESRLPLLADILGRNRALIAVLVVCSVVAGLAEAGVLAIVAQAAASLATGSHHVQAHVGPAHLSSSVGAILAVGGLLAFVRLALQAPVSYIPARISSDAQAWLRTSLLAAFTEASWTTQANDREGHFQELMGSQVIQSSQSAVQATTLVTSLAAAFVLLASALVLNPAAAGGVFLVSVALFALLRPLSAAGKRSAKRLGSAQLAHAAGVSEASRLAEETHVFGVAEAQRARISGLIEQARTFFFRTQLLQRLLPGLYQSLIYLLLVAGLLLVDLFFSGSVAALGAVVLLLVRAATYGNSVQNQYQSLKQSLPFLETVRGAEAAYRASTPTRGREPLGSIETLAFADVSFAYKDDRPILRHISFDVREGEAIGVVGPSGSGKSTVAQILLQLRAPTEGRYLVNGSTAADYREEDWHRLVSYVPQTPHLIHATVAENIRYLRDFPDEEIERAAKLAGIHDDIVEWPNGYETIVGPRADGVSGGQAQRICLARAIVSRPKMLLLDEPTSAVDLKSERLIQDSLLALKGSVTLFIIAHRISTLDMCDRVMVILDGELNAFESFARLRESNQYYSSVAAHAESSLAPPLGTP